MNDFLPFIGTRYNSEKIRIKNVVAPPYDVISSEQQKDLFTKDDYNVVRLELNPDADSHQSAKRYFDEWKREGILVRDREASFYVYYQTFKTPEGEQVTRRGVLGRLRVTPYSEGNVLPHEQTLSGPKKDRFALLDAARTNLSPIFGLIDDEADIFDHTIDSVTATAPLADIDETLPTGESIRHTMWRLTDPTLITRLEKLVAAKKIVIADGHHRYETAVAYASAHPEIAGADHIMIYLANLHAEGTVILPTHRILYGMDSFNQYQFLLELEKHFTIIIKDTREGALELFTQEKDALMLIQFPDVPKWVILKDQKEKSGNALEQLTVYRLHEEILKPIAGLTQEQINNKTNLLYPHTLKELDEMISGADYNAAFIIKAVTPQEMMQVTSEGSYMPQKSTYFYPKLLSGLVFYEFAANANGSFKSV